MISDDFKKKVIEQISHSGYPLELELIEKLRSSNNLVFPNISFLNFEGTIRELDIIAIIQSEKHEWNMGPVGLSLIIECKKTSKYPWVFFEQVYDPLDGLGLLTKVNYNSDFYDEWGKFNPLVGCMNTILASHHYNDVNIPKSRTYFELGKQDKDQSVIYKSIMNVFHGREFLNNWFNQAGKAERSKGRTYLNQYVIVLEGELILARKQGDSFDIDKANHILLTSVDTIASPNPQLTGNEIIIDVIAKDYFDSFHKIIKREAKDFCKHLSKIYESGLIRVC